MSSKAKQVHKVDPAWGYSEGDIARALVTSLRMVMTPPQPSTETIVQKIRREQEEERQRVERWRQGRARVKARGKALPPKPGEEKHRVMVWRIWRELGDKYYHEGRDAWVKQDRATCWFRKAAADTVALESGGKVRGGRL